MLICPKCKSTNIEYAGMSLNGGGYGSTDNRYYCRDCGYVGALIIEIGEEEKEMLEKEERAKTKNTKTPPED